MASLERCVGSTEQLQAAAVLDSSSAPAEEATNPAEEATKKLFDVRDVFEKVSSDKESDSCVFPTFVLKVFVDFAFFSSDFSYLL